VNRRPGRIPEGWGRFLVAIAVLLATAMLVEFFPYSPEVKLQGDFATFPMRVGGWESCEERMDQEIVDELGVDAYLYRSFRKGDDLPVALYIGFFGRQVTGDTVHSPKHCYPSSGWQEDKTGRVTINAGGKRFEANRYLVSKDGERQLVIYWYLTGSRAYASEYGGKFYRIWSALTSNRTDGALVRYSAPVIRSPEETEARELELISLTYPLLVKDYLPD